MRLWTSRPSGWLPLASGHGAAQDSDCDPDRQLPLPVTHGPQLPPAALYWLLEPRQHASPNIPHSRTQAPEGPAGSLYPAGPEPPLAPPHPCHPLAVYVARGPASLEDCLSGLLEQRPGLHLGQAATGGGLTLGKPHRLTEPLCLSSWGWHLHLRSAVWSWPQQPLPRLWHALPCPLPEGPPA